LFGSTTCESEDIDSEQDVFFAFEIAELDRLPLIAEKREIGSSVSDLEGDLSDLFILRSRRQKSRSRESGKQESSG